MIKFLTRRLIQMFILFVMFLSIIFLMLHAMPGDISDTLIGDPNIPLETRLELRERLGLDQPLYVQYWTYITNFFQGEMGVSFSRYPRDVSDVLLEALPRTIVLFFTATVVSFWAGFKAGKLIGWGRGEKTEQGFIVGGVALQTVFYPWFAIVMMWVFGFYLGWFPIGRFISVGLWQGSGFVATDVFEEMIISVVIASLVYGVVRFLVKRFSKNIVFEQRVLLASSLLVIAALLLYWFLDDARAFAADIAHHTILPVATLGLVSFGAIMLITRSSMLETMGEDYILTARAKGLSDRMIRDRHAARNALLPVTTSLVLALSFVIGGGIVTETVFSWPGMGLLFLQGIAVSDIPLVAGALAITGVLALFGHLIVDILYTFLDPRIRLS